MRKITLLIFCSIFISSIATAQSSSVIEKAARDFARMYQKEDFQKANLLFSKSGRVVIEVSSGYPEPIKKLYGSKAVINWIKSLHRDALPNPNLMDNLECHKMRCTFEGPMLHNNLYLSGISFQKQPDGNLIIKKIDLLSGD